MAYNPQSPNCFSYAGNPNTHVAGNAGVNGGAPPDLCMDVTNNIVYVCTTTGNAGAAVWTAVGPSTSGAYSFVSSATASSSAYVEFTGFSSGYDYIVAMNGVQPATDGTFLWAEYYIAGTLTTNQVGGPYVYATTAGGPSSGGTAFGNAYSRLTDTTCSNAANAYLHGEVVMVNPNNTTFSRKMAFSTLGWMGNAGNLSVGYATSFIQDATPSGVNGIRFLFNTGNIAVGTFALYKRQRS